VKIYKSISLKGKILCPPDKSITHRAIILSSIASGISIIDRYCMGKDCKVTLSIMKNLGVKIEKISKSTIIIQGVLIFSHKKKINCQNSGTAIRLLSGLFNSLKVNCILYGSQQLSLRPMKRIAEPLKKMGAKFFLKSNNFSPIIINRVKKKLAIRYELPIASAQVKSSILLSSLRGKETTCIIEREKSRDHTERMLSYMGANIVVSNKVVKIKKGVLFPINIKIPGDLSSAAFLIVAAILIKNSFINIKNVGLNDTRTGILDALLKMGAKIIIKNKHVIANEKVGDIIVCFSKLRGYNFSGENIVRMIDEIPILVLAATQAEGRTIISGVSELKVKESNRIKNLATELNEMGAKIKVEKDGFVIFGRKRLIFSLLNSYGDHRLGMVLVVASLIAKGGGFVRHSLIFKDSYPDFINHLRVLGCNITLFDE